MAILVIFSTSMCRRNANRMAFPYGNGIGPKNDEERTSFGSRWLYDDGEDEVSLDQAHLSRDALLKSP